MSSFNLNTQKIVKNFEHSITTFQNNRHYTSLLCLKPTTYGPKHPSEECYSHTKDCLVPENRDTLKHSCILPKGHTGKCKHKLPSIFKKNNITKKIMGSIDLAIYSTPGNDDYVFKNRSSRLYPIAISNDDEKMIRDKTEAKKKCAIPLKDASTPELLAQAYVDWITYVCNIEGIGEHFDTDSELFEEILEMVQKNKEHLTRFYKEREIFDKDGFTTCVIMKKKVTIQDFADPDRNNRTDIYDTDIQMGHNFPRSDSCVSIRGENLLPMSRRGNLIIGEHVFTQNSWIDELKRITSFY
jgi:hypothetical protein